MHTSFADQLAGLDLAGFSIGPAPLSTRYFTARDSVVQTLEAVWSDLFAMVSGTALEADADAIGAALGASADLRDVIASPVVARDDQAAVTWFRKAAEQGHANAQNELGRLLGGGFFRDDEAEYWFRKAAAQGHVQAQQNLEKLAQMKKARVAR